jgi:hypothetical protein
MQWRAILIVFYKRPTDNDIKLKHDSLPFVMILHELKEFLIELSTEFLIFCDF